MKFKANEILPLLLTIALIGLSACSDCEPICDSNGAQLGNTLRVIVPISRAMGVDDESQTSATADECRVNTLHLFAFPQNDAGKLVSMPLDVESQPTGSGNIAQYEIEVEPGSYKVYVVANIDADFSSITTEEGLKQLKLQFSAEKGFEQNNLPMLYEPDEAITVSPSSKKDVVADMQFMCVKVKYNIVMDASQASSTFGECGLTIDGVSGNNISKEETLTTTNKVLDNATIGINLTGGLFYDSFVKHASTTDDAYSVSSEGTTVPVNARLWLYQGIVYIPERYVSGSSLQSQLKFSATLTDGEGVRNESAKAIYTLPLGHEDENGVLQLPRSTYYDVVGNIKSLGNFTLDAVASIKAWTPEQVPLSFKHTSLWLNKTTASVKSLTDDIINYRTDAGYISTECIDCINDKPIIITENESKGSLRVKVNPEISLTEFQSSSYGSYGVARLAIKAGNLVKYVSVTYNVQPMFIVNPQELTIYYNPSDHTENTRAVTFTTNLGGITIDKTTSQIGVNSVITISCDDNDAAMGIINVTANTGPSSTVMHTFTITPKTSASGIDPITVKVYVKPLTTDYRIYLRAINDRHYMDGSTMSTNNYAGTLTEYTGTGDNNSNWDDGWDTGTWSTAINKYHHRAYIYTQVGETAGSNNVWYFSGNYPGTEMEGDNYNPGWYYYNLSATNKATADGVDRYPEPAETLLMFTNYDGMSGETSNQHDGPNCHRCPHHMDPGIPLFDYEDREGWILYDPTADPYYRVYDDKPEIVDVDYVVYSRYALQGWYHEYGVKNDHPETDGAQPFSIYDDNGNTFTTATVTLVPASQGESEYYLVGTRTSWLTNAVKFYKYDTGKYFARIDNFNGEFKIVKNKNWDDTDWGSNGNALVVGNPYEMTKETTSNITMSGSPNINPAIIYLEIEGNDEKATITVDNCSWKKATITLKSARDDYGKSITLKFSNGTKSVLFGGECYDVSGVNGTKMVIDGYYDSGNKWHKGKPIP